MDLSKAFDTINHDLLIAKLKTYRFSEEALRLMKSYLKNRKQKVQINNKFSSERDVIGGVPQGSIDGTLLFNLFINDLTFFIEQCTLSNYGVFVFLGPRPSAPYVGPRPLGPSAPRPHKFYPDSFKE